MYPHVHPAPYAVKMSSTKLEIEPLSSPSFPSDLQVFQLAKKENGKISLIFFLNYAFKFIEKVSEYACT